jgi:hypothetical protein
VEAWAEGTAFLFDVTAIRNEAAESNQKNKECESDSNMKLRVVDDKRRALYGNIAFGGADAGGEFYLQDFTMRTLRAQRAR